MKPVLMQCENETFFHKESQWEYSMNRMELSCPVSQNRCHTQKYERFAGVCTCPS